MKANEIKLGETYAVREVMPAAGGHGVGGQRVPRCAPVRHVTIIDKTSKGWVVCEYDALVPDPKQHLDAGVVAGRLIPFRHYVSGKKLLRIPAADVICLSADWAPTQPDGRVDAPVTTRAAGRTFSQHRIAV